MKKYIISFLFVVFLTSCGEPAVDIEQAKKEMLETPTTQEQETSTTTQEIASTPEASQPEPKAIEIRSITEEQFIEIDRIDESTIDSGEVKISGKTLGNVDRVEVLFSNTDSVFPDDTYELQTFKAGDVSFKYVASSKFQVLDFGTNLYTIKAYNGDDVSQTEVIIRAVDPDADTVTFEDKIIGTEDSSLEIPLPVSESFGSPVSLGANSFTYSDINGLEIVKTDVSELNCEGLTESLQESINTWFYWNTCRDTVKDKGISYYVIRLSDKENYVYEKHYIDYEHGLYTTYEVQTGTDVTKDNISDKNKELKELNDSFENVTLVDSLVKTITIQK